MRQSELIEIETNYKINKNLEVWSPRIDEYFKKKLHAAPHFMDFSNEVAQGGDTV